jgi:DNA-binding transcriptional LysR family regulator
MELQRLRYFIAAAELLNVSRAAERMNVSQPAMSRQIQLLETELGILLFERVRKHIRLTGAGRMFLGRARRVIREAESAVMAVREEFGGKKVALRVGFIAMLMDDLVVPSVTRFQRETPGVEIELSDQYPRPMLQMLRAGELDVAFTAEPVEAELGGLHATPIWQHRLSAVIPDTHRLARQQSLRLADLRDTTWVTLSERTVSVKHRALEEAFLGAGFQPERVVEAGSWQTLLAAVATGQGVTLLPDHASKLAHAGCRFLPISVPDVRLNLCAFRRIGDQRTELATLVRVFRARADELARG